MNFIILGWFLVYIALERFLSIGYPHTEFGRKLKSKHTQILIAFIIVSVIAIFDIPLLIYIDLIYSPTHIDCWYNKIEASIIIFRIDLFRDSILPFGLISVFTILMIRFIYLSRKKVFPRQTNLISKDMKFSVTVICLNIFVFILKLPYSIFINIVVNDYFAERDTFANSFSFRMILALSQLLFYSVHSVPFFIYLGFNSMFRKEFISMVKNKKSKVHLR